MHDKFRHMRNGPLRQTFGDGAPQVLERPQPTSEDAFPAEQIGNSRNRCHRVAWVMALDHLA
jgi:hypothetical protein